MSEYVQNAAGAPGATDDAGAFAALRHAAAVAALIVASFLSFQYNFFGAADERFFDRWDLGSEQLVLDGILAADQPYSRGLLGLYRRNVDDSDEAHKFFERADRSGPFYHYESQFGLALHLFAPMHALGARPATMQAFNSAMMSLVVAGFFIVLRREFGSMPAAAAALAIVLSPWTLSAARNLFWMEWTWFLPVLVTAAFAPQLAGPLRAALPAAGLFAVALLVKLLCGYDYATTVCFAAAVPVVYWAVRERRAPAQVAASLTLLVAAAFAAAVVSFALFATKLGSADLSASQQIAVVAKKRLSSQNPDELAAAACKDFLPRDRAACEADFRASLAASHLKVAAMYFSFSDLVPWLSSLRTPQTPQAQAALHAAAAERSPAAVWRWLREHTWAEQSYYVLKLVNTLVFVALLALLVRKLHRIGRRAPEFLFASAVAFVAPLTWILVFKGHSYAHPHLNFVLWYLPFIPWLVLVLAVDPQRPRPGMDFARRAGSAAIEPKGPAAATGSRGRP